MLSLGLHAVSVYCTLVVRVTKPIKPLFQSNGLREPFYAIELYQGPNDRTQLTYFLETNYLSEALNSFEMIIQI